MKSNYTVSTNTALSSDIHLDLCQITLNLRLFPSRRKTVEYLKKFSEAQPNRSIIVHYDFTYIPTRFAMFKDHVRTAITTEVKNILDFSKSCKQVKGIVFHTDYPVTKEYFKSGNKDEFIKEHYKASCWDTERIYTLFKSPDSVGILGICEFIESIKNYLSSDTCPIFLENTTKCGPSKTMSVDNLIDLASKYHYVGVCYDTEHAYAVTGEIIPIENLLSLSKKIPLLVHLNTIPEEVKPCSCKDRHSFTIIPDNSVKSFDIMNYAKVFDCNNIPYIREVKEETMLKELEWLKTQSL